MSLLLGSVAFLLTVISAVALYAAAPHCVWRPRRHWQRRVALPGLLCAMLSLAVWIVVLGGSVGLCMMLATWMLALVAMPYLALLHGKSIIDATTAVND